VQVARDMTQVDGRSLRHAILEPAGMRLPQPRHCCESIGRI